MKRLAIFAGYDKDNIIDDYVVYYIKELKKIADIIYVSDCDMLENELTKISEYCINIINGRHGEYDFGSYKRGYIYAKENNLLNNYDYLILCNDSCYGPFFNFQEIVENMESRDTDTWGIFKYLADIDYDEHLQSYFLSMKKKVFLSDWFTKFIYSVKKESDKLEIIKKYENGLGVLLKNNNVTTSSFLDSSIKTKEEKDNNIPFYNIDITEKYGFPFIKISSITYCIYSKVNAKQLTNLMQFIQPFYNTSLIINHLNRIFKKENIKYLFPRFKTFNSYFINKKFINIYTMYSFSKKYQFIFLFFNKIKLTINLPEKLSYINHQYKDLNFLIK